MEIKEIKIKLRPATPEDLKVNNTTLKIGQPFWVKSMQTGNFDNKNYIITRDSNINELAAWLTQKMIWVPVSDLDLKNLNTK